MYTNKRPSATRWAAIFALPLFILAWVGPWGEVTAAPAYQSQTTGTANAASITLANPTGAVQNDVLIAAISTRGGTVTAPAGWTQVRQQTQGGETLAVFYLRYNASTPGSHTFTPTSSAGTAGAILRYTGVDGLQAIDVSGIATGTSTSPTAPDVTTTVADTTVVRVAGIGDDTLTAVPATSRVLLNYNAGAGSANDVALGMSDATHATAGSTGTAAFTSGNDAWVAVTLALRPFTTTLCANPPSSGTTSLTAGIYNTYYPGTATANAGAVSISVGTSRGAATAIAAGDLLLVMQMQDAAINTSNDERYGDGTGTAGNTTGNGSGATNYNNAGKYEFVVAKGAVSGGSVPIEGKGAGGGLINTYTNANASTTQGQRRFQVVRVPQYFNATVTGAVTASAWDGTSGGIAALDVAGTLSFSGGSINVNALGFRGGGGQGLTGGGGANTDYRTRITVNTNGNKAEGVAGSPNNIYDGTGTLATGTGYPDGTNTDASRARGAPGNAGGGGTDGNPSANDQNSGGGGGGNGGAGGTGGNTWSSNLPRGGFGGATFPHSASTLALGGGGGSGARNNSSGVQSSGGLGGGIILIRANSISGTATLSANGGVGVTPANDGGGGGGAGGSVLVFARSGVLTSLTITATGANGTNADPTGSAHGPGGGGAGGVIYLSSAAGSTSVTGGANGTTTLSAIAFGATPGAAGATNTTLTEGLIPGVISGATCKATLASIAEFGATVEGGRVVLHWETAFELGTAGFHVERLDPIGGDYERLNEALLPALITSPQGGRYHLVDPDAWPDRSYTYRLVEQEVWGGTRVHGPYRVTPVAPARHVARMAFAAESQADSSEGEGYDDPGQGYQAVPHALGRRNLMRTVETAGPMPSKNKAAGVAQVSVRRDGLFYLSVADLAQALGSTDADVRKWLNKNKLELTTAGKDVAWLPAADATGILFYGEAIDSLYALDNVYRLRSKQKGERMEESPARERAPRPVAAGDFDDRITAEQDRFPATVVATDPESDYWYWEGFIGGNDPNWNSKRFTLSLPNVAGNGTLQIFLKGAAPGAHPVQVSINGHPLGTGTWNDLADYELRLPLARVQLQSGDNSLEVRALGGSSNLFYLDRIEVQYRRMAHAANDRLTLAAERDGPLAVSGFSTTDIYVFDITHPNTPIWVRAATVAPGAVGQSVTFNASKGHRYLTLTGGAITPGVPAPMTAADLGSSRDRVDYLVIAPPALRDAAQTLADYRRGKGLRSRVVGTDEIYDSFNWGVPSPHALREFLRQTAGRWGMHYVVLVGIGSFDYRNLWGLGEPQTPTLMTPTAYGLFGCDNCLTDFDGDGAPDVAIGRIPAASTANVETYLAKLRGYESASIRLQEAGALLLADHTDPAAGYFSQDSDWVGELLPSGMDAKRIYLDLTDIDTARSLLFAGMNGGAGWVNYLGHGGMDGLGAQWLLSVDDLDLLRSGGTLPVVSALTCAANRFEVPGYAPLGARLALDPDGGAIAVWSATGLSLNTPAVDLNRSLFDAVFQQWIPTLGEAVQQAIEDNIGRVEMPAYLLRVYSLLGDPALELAQ